MIAMLNTKVFQRLGDGGLDDFSDFKVVGDEIVRKKKKNKKELLSEKQIEWIKKRLLITPVRWKVTDGVHTIYVERSEEGYSISTKDMDTNFLFMNYKTVQGLTKGKGVIKLLQKAIEFIEGELK